MTENPKRDINNHVDMSLKLKWILYLVAIICCFLAIVGGLSYPLINQGLLEIMMYEAVVFLVTFGILLLVYKRALPET